MKEKMQSSKGAAYSVHMNANGDKYVKIDDDILQNVAQKEWKNVVKKYMSDNFSEGFELNGQHIKVNRKSRMEYTNSRYTRKLENQKTENSYYDKMMAVNNLDEIVENTRNIKNEPPKHPRKDNFITFNRGEIDIEIGGKTYIGEVVIGETKQGEKVFYDLVNLKDANQMATPHSNLNRKRFGSRELNDNSRAAHLTASIDDNLSNSARNVNYKNVTKETGQNDVELVFKEQLVIDFFIG